MASVVTVFATNAGLARDGHVIQWNNLPFESVFQLWGLFDTPKNRVVTSKVIWLFLLASPFQVIEEPLDTAQLRSKI